MMKRTIKTLAYFDTNVFDNLLKKSGGITDADEACLKRLIDSKKLSILPSVLNIQETLAALKSRRAEFVVVPQLALVESLSDWEIFIKPHDLLLTDDVRHFAWNGEAASPFLSEREVGLLHSSVRRVLNGSEDAEMLNEIVNEDRQQKEDFLHVAEQLQAELSPQVRSRDENERIFTFAEFFEDAAEKAARYIAKRCERADDCEQRGIARLLKVRSVRATAGLILSFLYRTGVEGKKPKIGASRDMQHAACATAADTFVTHDAELTYLLHRVPIDSFNITTLHGLLEKTA